jgi:hypothetical protein
MAILKRIARASAFKVGLVVYGLLGLVPGVFCSAVTLAEFTLPLMRPCLVLLACWP